MTDTAKYAYWGVSNPNHAIQIYSGNYLVSDFGNNRIIELDSTLSTLVRAYFTSGVVFFDYSEDNETLLLTYGSSNTIVEVTWSELDFGTILWQSTASFNNPQCATYKQDNVNQIVIADMDNNRICFYDRNLDSYRYISRYKISSDDTSTSEMADLYKPYRIYQYSNGNICVIEKEGRTVDFATVGSSSSSSSSSFICCVERYSIDSDISSRFSDWEFDVDSGDAPDCRLFVSMGVGMSGQYLIIWSATGVPLASGSTPGSFPQTISLNPYPGKTISGSVYWNGLILTKGQTELFCS